MKMTAGPGRMYKDARKAMQGNKDLENVLDSIRESLQRMEGIHSDGEICLVQGGGTAALEMTFRNFISEEDSVLVLDSGVYGGILTELAEIKTDKVSSIRVDDEDEIEEELLEEKIESQEADFFVVVHVDTPSGRKIDLSKIQDIISDTETKLIVDAVSSLGVESFPETPKITVFSGHKTFCGPSGVGGVSVSPEVWKDRKDPESRYLDASRYKLSDSKFTRYTASTMRGLDKALEITLEPGVEENIKKHERLSQAVRAGIREMNLDVYPFCPANSVTAVKSDEADKIREEIRESGIEISGGLKYLEGKIFRIGHMGSTANEEKILETLGELARIQGVSPHRVKRSAKDVIH